MELDEFELKSKRAEKFHDPYKNKTRRIKDHYNSKRFKTPSLVRNERDRNSVHVTEFDQILPFLSTRNGFDEISQALQFFSISSKTEKNINHVETFQIPAIYTRKFNVSVDDSLFTCSFTLKIPNLVNKEDYSCHLKRVFIPQLPLLPDEDFLHPVKTPVFYSKSTLQEEYSTLHNLSVIVDIHDRFKACWSSTPPPNPSFSQWHLTFDLGKDEQVSSLLISSRSPKVRQFPTDFSANPNFHLYNGPTWQVIDLSSESINFVDRFMVSVRSLGGKWVFIKDVFKSGIFDFLTVKRIDLELFNIQARYIRIHPLSKQHGGFRGDFPAMRVQLLGKKNRVSRLEEMEETVSYTLSTVDESKYRPNLKFISGQHLISRLAPSKPCPCCNIKPKSLRSCRRYDNARIISEEC